MRNNNVRIHQEFLEASEKKAFDKEHRKIIAHNMSAYETAAISGKAQFANLELARRRAAEIKHRVIEHLEDNLKTFEQQITSRGATVIWAQDKEEAREAVLQILEQNFVKEVVKSKSMVTEEIGISEFLLKNGIECLETDLGEYIVQISNDRPYHIVTPAMHLSAADVAKIFHKQFGLSEKATPGEITKFVRETLRPKFMEAQAGITGANFLVAESGAVAITENEGNALFSVSFPKIHIVITGIEKLIPATADLSLFWPLLASHGTGQKISAYNTLLYGPRAEGETDGPEQMYVILLDNGRTNLLAQIPQRRALSCIRCGACLNVCPVYRNIGGHTYHTTYSGPIGAVISPFLSKQFAEYVHLSYASSLCGACTDCCPVAIDLHHQLLQNRQMAVKKRLPAFSERMGIKAYKVTMSKSGRLHAVSPKVKNIFARVFLNRAWGPRRVLPKFVRSFRERFAEKQAGP
ncbi:MAG: lactate utilization protein [Bacteroidia bacterium]|nr:MAG: lactate utilization protein [Bacteroidia bacterium]